MKPEISKHYFQTDLNTPIGWLQITATQQAVCSVLFTESRSQHRANAITRQASEQLEAYFAGERKHFNLPLSPQGTDFQNAVWRALQRVEYGQTRHYGYIAECLGKPKAVRAVGAANGRNPISIIIPCHRIIGANGTLTGYAGGLQRKAWLLNWEQHQQ